MNRVPAAVKAVRVAYVEVFRHYPLLAWIACVALLGQIAVASINSFSLSFYILDDLKQPGHVLGFLTMSFLVVETALKLPFGHLSDRYGRRVFVVLGSLAVVVMPVVILFVSNGVILAAPITIYLIFIPLRMLGGAGSAAIWPPLFAAVPDLVPKAQRGTGMAVINSGYIAGLALGPALAGITTHLWQRQLHHKAPFAMAAVAALLAALVARTLPAKTVVRTPRRQEPVTSLGLGVITVIIVITTAEMFATATLAPYLAPFVHLAAGLSRVESGLFLLMIGIPAAILGVPIGRLVDRLPKRRVRQISLVVTAAGMWAVPLGRSIAVLTIAGLVVVVGFLFGLPAWLALISDLAPRGQSGRVMGILATAEGIGASFGPLAGGYLWDTGIRHPFYASAAMLTLAALVSVIFMGPRWGEAVPGAAGESDDEQPGAAGAAPRL
jgi:DHA1 family multidrug resistance protein-like MFS transporter